MAAMGMGFSSVFSLIFLTAGLGLPVGVPPLPEDPLLARIAPEECLWYWSSAGIATPDPNSTNATEQLLAEAEIQQLIKTVEASILAKLDAEAGDSEHNRVVAREMPRIIKTLLTRPAAIYVSKVTMSLEGPQINAGLIVNAGDQIEALRKSLEAIEKLAPPEIKIDTFEAAGIEWHRVPLSKSAPRLCWGIRGRYLIAGIEQESVEGIMKNAATEAPEWLVKAKEQFEIDRVSTISYLDAGKILKTYGPLVIPGPLQDTLKDTGLGKIVSVAGLDESGLVSHTLVGVEADSAGLAQRLVGDALKSKDLSGIPQDAVLAGAMRLDADKLYQGILEMADKVDPNVRKQVSAALEGLQQELGVDVENDILKSLGDVWTIHTSPADGGFPWMGAIATVSIKDRASFAKAHDRLVEIARQMLPDPPERRRAFTLRDFKFQGQTVYFLNAIGEEMPVAPSWCLTEDRLIVGLFPQSIKGYLVRDSSSGSLSDLPEVKDRLSAEHPPFALTYADTKTLFNTFYPVLQVAAQMGLSQLQKEGIDLDVSILPSARTIARHLGPDVSTVSRTEAGIVFSQRRTLPVQGNLLTTAPIAVALILPAVQSARGAARRTSDMNRLKQIGLAMHLHHDVKKRFPPPIFGKIASGEAEKPGLSWRVAILPYIEEDALYRQFRLNEPWDSEHNKKLIPKMPKFYRSAWDSPYASTTATARARRPREEQPKQDQRKTPMDREFDKFKTRFVTLRDPKTAFPADSGSGISKGLRIGSITDGTSNTIMVVEAPPKKAVIWTKPDDLPIDLDDPVKSLFGSTQRILAVFCDGHVRVIERTVSKEVLKAMATRNGGEAIPRD